MTITTSTFSSRGSGNGMDGGKLRNAGNRSTYTVLWELERIRIPTNLFYEIVCLELWDVSAKFLQTLPMPSNNGIKDVGII